jgi:glycosyltransferase involved in cell wall biosynthesis
VFVVARSAEGLEEREVRSGALVRRIAGSRVEFSSAVMRAVSSMKPDAVLAQYSALPPSVAAARRRKVPCLGIVHDVYGLSENLRTRGRVRGAVRWAGLERSLRMMPPDAVLVPSRATAEGVKALLDVPVTVVPAGADHLVASVRRVQGADDAAARFLFVGRLVASKGVSDLIEAVRVIRSEGTNVSASIVGSGPAESDLRKAAAGLGDAVSFEGSVTDEELGALMGGATALLLPSTREGWGLAITEAAARGVPYIAYDIPAVREQHEMLGGGLLVPPGVDHLASAMREIADDPARAVALGAAGRAAASRMSWDAAAEVVQDAIFAAIGRRVKR